MRIYKEHTAGPYENKKQVCLDCGFVLCDHTNGMWPDDQDAPKGFEPGLVYISHQQPVLSSIYKPSGEMVVDCRISLVCEHEKFYAGVRVGRITETDEPGSPVKGFMADIQINCTDCGQPFAFIGLPGGYAPFEPRTNADSTEARMPIAPATGEIIFQAKHHEN